MKCTEAQGWLSRRIDGELKDDENRELDHHLELCARCARAHRLLMLPRRVAEATPSFAPSSFFYQTLSARISGEIERAANWRPFGGLARQLLPALAGVTLVLLSVFAYHQLRGPDEDLYSAYSRALVSQSLPHQLSVSEAEKTTNENVLNTIAEREFNHLLNMGIK
jgi:hypothetical protein